MSVLKAITKEYFGEIKRKEDMLVLIPNKRNNVTIIDKDNLLTTSQLDLLQDAASLNFNLGGYSSLADMLNTLGVEVHIRKGGIEFFEDSYLAHYLDEAEKYWRERLYCNDPEAEKRLGEIMEERESCREINEDHLLHDSKPRRYVLCYRGKYIRDKKIIVLYPEVMKAERDGLKYFEELLVSTLAHEAMHAYFDRHGHNHYPYAYFVEEPMAEFGMLVYLKETAMYGTGKMISWAENDVSQKRWRSYRYGAWLFKQYCDWNCGLRNYLEEYKYAIEEYAMPDIDKGREIIALPCPILKGCMTSSPGKATLESKLRVEHNRIVIQSKTSADTMRDSIDAAIDAVAGRYSIPNILALSGHWSCPKTKGSSKVPLLSNDSRIYVRYRKLKHSDIGGKPLFVNTNQSVDSKKEILENIFEELGLHWNVSVEE